MDTSKNYYESVTRDFQTYGLAALLNSTAATRQLTTSG